MDQEGTQSDEGLSRRRFVTKVGVGAGVAWSAPTVLSMASAAYAGSVEPGGCDGAGDSCNYNLNNCRALARCFCTNDAGGPVMCACFDRGGCGGYVACTSTADCPSGERCTFGSGCCGGANSGVCVPPCTPTCGGGAPQGANAQPMFPPFAA